MAPLLGYPDLWATASHLVIVQRQLDKLAKVKDESWAQLIAGTKRLYLSGKLGMPELCAIASTMKDQYGHGFTKIWDPGMPMQVSYAKLVIWARGVESERKNAEFNRPNGPGPLSWNGHFPLSKDQPMPQRGHAVVYVLFDEANVPSYVGSTENWWARMADHQKFKSGLKNWVAHLCRDREHAFTEEDRLLKEHMPRMNVRRGR